MGLTQHQEYEIPEFSEHLNSLDPNIKFTPKVEQDGKIPFPETYVPLEEEGKTRMAVCRKSTHKDQYASNHRLEHKRSAVHLHAPSGDSGC